MLKFNFVYFTLTVLLLLTEVTIACFVHDTIIRPYVGDMLAVILIYCFVKSFLNLPVLPTVIGVLLLSYAIEMLQYFNFVEVIGWQHNRFARIVMGNSFDFQDFVSYTIGVLPIIGLEKFRKNKNRLQ